MRFLSPKDLKWKNKKNSSEKSERKRFRGLDLPSLCDLGEQRTERRRRSHHRLPHQSTIHCNGFFLLMWRHTFFKIKFISHLSSIREPNVAYKGKAVSNLTLNKGFSLGSPIQALTCLAPEQWTRRMPF